MTIKNDFIEEARVIAAHCWQDKETEHITMDPVLADAVAKRIAFWMSTAAQNERNTEYYQKLLDECGKYIGNRAHVADDGSVHTEVLRAKVPEIIKEDYGERIDNIKHANNGLAKDLASEKTKNKMLTRALNEIEKDLRKATAHIEGWCDVAQVYLKEHKEDLNDY